MRAPTGVVAAVVTLVVTLTAIARLALAGLRRLSPDEAYYLCAARSTSAPWPIADHPPGLGALLALADRAAEHVGAGSIEARVRLVAILCQPATALGVGALAASCADDRERAFGWGALLATLGLMPWVSGLVATPDAPLLAACAWLLVFAGRARDDAHPSHAVALFALSALAVASKVVALAVVAAVAWDLARAPRSRVLAALAAIAGAASALPLASSSLGLQLAHALGRGPLVSAPHVGAPLAVAGALSGAFALFGPAVVVLAARGRARLSMLVGGPWIVAGLGAAFVASALASGRPPEPNWIAPAMLPLYAVAGATAADALARRGRAIAMVVHVAPAIVGVGLWLAPGLPRGARDPLARVPRVDTGAAGLRAAASAADLPAYAAPAWSCAYGNSFAIPSTSELTFHVTVE